MRSAARSLMDRFDVRAASEDVAFGSLSGGNQQKAVLARELTQDGLALLIAEVVKVSCLHPHNVTQPRKCSPFQ